MCSDTQAGQTHLFVLRLWLEPLGKGRTVIRGEVRHLRSGRRHRVKDWSSLAAFMDECISGRDPCSSNPQPDENQDADNTH